VLYGRNDCASGRGATPEIAPTAATKFRRCALHRRASILLTAALGTSPLRAERVDVPLLLMDATLLASRVSAASLDMGADGSVRVRQDDCNWVDVADLEVATGSAGSVVGSARTPAAAMQNKMDRQERSRPSIPLHRSLRCLPSSSVYEHSVPAPESQRGICQLHQWSMGVIGGACIEVVELSREVAREACTWVNVVGVRRAIWASSRVGIRSEMSVAVKAVFGD
jgi:hypothetical protein